MLNRNLVFAFLALCVTAEQITPIAFATTDSYGVRYVTGSKIFGTKFTEGVYGTHSKGRSSLLIKSADKWQMVWNAIGGWPLFAWGHTALFVAVTSPSGDVRYLVHKPELGTVDIDTEIHSFKAAALAGRKNSAMLDGRTRWKLIGDEIVWRAEAEGPAEEVVEIKIKLQRLEDMAKKVRARNSKRVFNGNEFFE